MRKIQELMKSKELDNTGEASSSLEVQGNKLLGIDYFYYLDHGRGPGKFPPVDKIRDWVSSKLGITGKEINSIAYLIGRKISNEGSEIYKDNSLGIELDRLIDETLEELNKELPDAAAAEVMKWL
jgi:hypothetical protein